MSDAGWAVLWIIVLGGALGGCVWAHRLGLATTYVRDLLHIGAGAWVLGWPWWRRPWLAIGITAVATFGVALVPRMAQRFPLVAHLHNSLSDTEERWTGLTHYCSAFAVLTALGLLDSAFPAAAALLALALGDGIGGLVGRRWGSSSYEFPFSKLKTLEGSAVVLIASGLGIFIAARWMGVPLSLWRLIFLGLVACAAEALAPRGTDNLMLPASVWLAARGLQVHGGIP